MDFPAALLHHRNDVSTRIDVALLNFPWQHEYLGKCKILSRRVLTFDAWVRMSERGQMTLRACQKAQAALECARRVRPVDAIAADYGVAPAQLLQWEGILVERAASLFGDDEIEPGMSVTQLATQQMQINEALVAKVFEQEHVEEALRESTRVLHELLAHQDRIKEEERKRIAREIHDELGQNLLALRIDISVLHERTARRHPRLNQRVNLALQNIDITIKSIRSIINDLRPFELELGLQAAVEWQLRRFERVSGMTCVLSAHAMQAEAPLSDAPMMAVFRILQESLSNIARHASASRVEVELGCDERTFTMLVRDDGIGASSESIKKDNSFGLVGIAERVGALGGQFRFNSGGNGVGTVLSIEIPVA
jgi:signal transduction histidine kinase